MAICIFAYIFSQVTPAPNNHAANCLSTANQERNIRSVEVNAEITMMIWIMESIANFCSVVGFIVASGKPHYSNLTIVILWYYVILPYTFLMNTSYNKDRIINDGWKIVILNVLIKPYLFYKNVSSVDQLSIPIQSLNGTTGNLNKNSDNLDPESNSILETSSDPITSDQSLKMKIFTISTRDFNSTKIQSNQCMEIEDLDAVPSTSRNKINNLTPHQPKTLSTRSESSESEHYYKNSRLRTRKKIFGNMLEEMENEDAYFHFFHELLEFEQLLKEKKLNEFINFDIHPFENIKKLEYDKVKASGTINRQYEKIKNGKQMRRKRGGNTYEILTPSAKMKENGSQTFSMKVQLRRAAIKHLLQLVKFWDDEDLYDDSFNSLIDLEESLAEGLLETR